jgi:predicted nucleotide-binding protein
MTPFTAGRTLLEDLDDIGTKVDAALLLFSPEATSTIRGNPVQVPNLNVLFEFGYFLGHFGRSKVAMLKYGDFYLPSDLGGYIHINGSKFFERAKVVQVGKRTVREFDRWVAQV